MGLNKIKNMIITSLIQPSTEIRIPYSPGHEVADHVHLHQEVSVFKDKNEFI